MAVNQTIYQIYQSNPAGALQSTDVIPLARSPYASGDTYAIDGAHLNFNLQPQGNWNASTNSPTLSSTPADASQMQFYVVTTAGTQFAISWSVGDWILSNGSAWVRIPSTDFTSSLGTAAFQNIGLLSGNIPQLQTGGQLPGVGSDDTLVSNPSTSTITSLSVALADIFDAGSNVEWQYKYLGMWDAATNSPTLNSTPPADSNNNFYLVNAPGTQFSIPFNIGDLILSAQTMWIRIPAQIYNYALTVASYSDANISVTDPTTGNPNNLGDTLANIFDTASNTVIGTANQIQVSPSGSDLQISFPDTGTVEFPHAASSYNAVMGSHVIFGNNSYGSNNPAFGNNAVFGNDSAQNLTTAQAVTIVGSNAGNSVIVGGGAIVIGEGADNPGDVSGRIIIGSNPNDSLNLPGCGIDYNITATDALTFSGYSMPATIGTPGETIIVPPTGTQLEWGTSGLSDNLTFNGYNNTGSTIQNVCVSQSITDTLSPPYVSIVPYDGTSPIIGFVLFAIGDGVFGSCVTEGIFAAPNIVGAFNNPAGTYVYCNNSGQLTITPTGQRVGVYTQDGSNDSAVIRFDLINYGITDGSGVSLITSDANTLVITDPSGPNVNIDIQPSVNNNSVMVTSGSDVAFQYLDVSNFNGQLNASIRFSVVNNTGSTINAFTLLSQSLDDTVSPPTISVVPYSGIEPLIGITTSSILNTNTAFVFTQGIINVTGILGASNEPSGTAVYGDPGSGLLTVTNTGVRVGVFTQDGTGADGIIRFDLINYDITEVGVTSINSSDDSLTITNPTGPAVDITVNNPTPNNIRFIGYNNSGAPINNVCVSQSTVDTVLTPPYISIVPYDGSTPIIGFANSSIPDNGSGSCITEGIISVTGIVGAFNETAGTYVYCNSSGQLTVTETSLRVGIFTQDGSGDSGNIRFDLINYGLGDSSSITEITSSDSSLTITNPSGPVVDITVTTPLNSSITFTAINNTGSTIGGICVSQSVTDAALPPMVSIVPYDGSTPIIGYTDTAIADGFTGQVVTEGIVEAIGILGAFNEPAGTFIYCTSSTGELTISPTGQRVGVLTQDGFGDSGLIRFDLINYRLSDNTTSQGTWAPTDLSGASLSFSVYESAYSQSENLVNFILDLNFPTTTDTNETKIAGLSFFSQYYGNANAPFQCIIYFGPMTSATIGLLNSSGYLQFIDESTGLPYTNDQLSMANINISGTFGIA